MQIRQVASKQILKLKNYSLCIESPSNSIQYNIFKNADKHILYGDGQGKRELITTQ